MKELKVRSLFSYSIVVYSHFSTKTKPIFSVIGYFFSTAKNKLQLIFILVKEIL